MVDFARRVLSGMRASGRLHLGNYHGALKNWVRLQSDYDCFYFVADWHGLTTHYGNPEVIQSSTWEMLVDWFAAGIDSSRSTVFIQSKVPEHAELHVLLSMITPLSWLERVPTYKDQISKIKDRDLQTYGFLGYPLMQSADILMYRAGNVPVGADQVAHINITREIARRFNNLYGHSAEFERELEQLLLGLAPKLAQSLARTRGLYLEQGDEQALSQAHAEIDAAGCAPPDKALLWSYLVDSGKMLLPECQALLTEAARMPGLDGQKMSKSYGNTITLRAEDDEISKQVRTMPTDPARVRRSDPGNPELCPVWQFHLLYSDQATQAWVQAGCTSADIGCLQCKQRVIDALCAEVAPMRERGRVFASDRAELERQVNAGIERARAEAQDTLTVVRSVMGL